MDEPIKFSIILPKELNDWLKKDAKKTEPGRTKTAHIRLILFNYMNSQIKFDKLLGDEPEGMEEF